MMISILGLIIHSSLFIVSAVLSGVWSYKFFYRKVSSSSSGNVASITVSGIRFLSVLTVAFSVVIAELVLCEIGDWVAPEARFFVWKLSTNVLLSLVGLVIPFAELVLLVGSGSGSGNGNNAKGKIKFLFVLILYAVYLALFVAVGHYIPMEGDAVASAAPKGSSSSIFATDLQLSFTESIITRIGFVGVTAMAILCGVSTVSAPYTVFMSRQNVVSQNDIDRLQSAIITTNSLIEGKKHNLRSLRLRLSQRINNSSSSNLMLKVLTTLRVGTGGDELSNEINALDSEIASLQSMKSDLERDIDSIKTKFTSQIYAQTIQGKINTRLYYIFAIYCIYRLINILIIRNPLTVSWELPKRIYRFGTSTSATSNNAESDALVMSLAHIVMMISPQSDLDALSRQIGFAVSGLLFLASISSVITTFNTLAKAFPFLHTKKHHPSTSSSTSTTGHLTSPLLIAHVLSIYVISTSLLLRSNLPTKMSTAITSALGSPLNVSSVQTWSDSVIFASTCVMIVGLYLASKYRAEETSFYDEESLIESKFD